MYLKAMSKKVDIREAFKTTVHSTLINMYDSLITFFKSLIKLAKLYVVSRQQLLCLTIAVNK